MSTTATSGLITHNLPEFPYSAASDARRRLLSTLLSNSHFVTTVVSPGSPSPAPSAHHHPQDNAADPPPSPSHNADSSSTEIAAHPPPPEIPSSTARSQSFKHSPPSPQSPSEPARLKHGLAPSWAFGSKHHPPLLIGTGQECLPWPPPRRRSAWRRFKRMGNHFVTPLRSMGLCFTACTGGRRAVACCEDFSSNDASPGSSWYSSGEYPPEFIRAVLENNALFGQLAVE